MQKNKIISRTFDQYLNKNLELRVQFYNLLAFVGIAAGIIVSCIAVLSKTGIAIIIINLMVSPLSYVMLRFAEKKKYYHLCSWVWVILIFMIAFPILFFLCGGNRSGTSCFFILAIAFTSLLFEKHERIIATIIEFLLYIVCCLAAYCRPEMVVVLSSDFAYTLHSILNFISCGILLLITVLMRSRMINSRQIQIEELNRELEARNETLKHYDNMKSTFLATVAHEINTPLAIISASSTDTLDLLDESPFRARSLSSAYRRRLFRSSCASLCIRQALMPSRLQA